MEIPSEITPEMIPVIILAVVQVLKEVPAFVNLTKTVPIPLVSFAIGIGLAFLTGLPNPVVTGIFGSLIASGGYDILKLPSKTLKK